MADDAVGHGAESSIAELGGVPAFELGPDLVEPGSAAGAAVDGRHVIEAERQQHGFFEPLVDPPLAAVLLGDPGLAGIQQIEGGVDGNADVAGGAGADLLAVIPDAVDGRLQGGGAHGVSVGGG